MTGPFESDLDQTKMAVAILAACVVKTLCEVKPTLRGRFLHHLEKSYREAQKHLGTECLETLALAREVFEIHDFDSLFAPK